MGTSNTEWNKEIHYNNIVTPDEIYIQSCDYELIQGWVAFFVCM